MRKLTPKQREDRLISKIEKRIISIEKQYGIAITRKACSRYYHKRGSELKLKRDIKEKKKQLEDLKKQSRRR